MPEIGRLVAFIDGDTSGFERAFARADRQLRKTSRNMTAAGRQLSLTVTAPIVAAGAGALKASIDFESAFAGVRKTVDATEPQLEELRQGIRDMAKELPTSATEIAGVAEAAGQLGIETENILEFTRVMVDLGETTNLSARDAASALARLANVMGTSEKDFDRLGSTIVDLGNNSATTEAEIVEMAQRIGGAGKTVGLTEAEVLAFAAALSSVGIEAQAGGSAISRLMVNLASEVATGGDNLETFAAVAGMTADEFKTAFEEDAAGAIIRFIEGLGKVEDAGGNVFGVLEALGLTEVRLRDALLRSANAGDLLRESIDLGNTAWEENNALSKEAAQRYDTTAAKLEVAWNRMMDVAITAGDALAPALIAAVDAGEPLIEMLAAAAEGFADLPQPVQTTIIGFTGFVAAAGPVLFIGGQMAATLAVLARAMRVAGASSIAMGAGMRTGAGGVSTLAAALGALAPVAAVLTAGALGLQELDKALGVTKKGRINNLEDVPGWARGEVEQKLGELAAAEAEVSKEAEGATASLQDQIDAVMKDAEETGDFEIDLEALEGAMGGAGDATEEVVTVMDRLRAAAKKGEDALRGVVRELGNQARAALDAAHAAVFGAPTQEQAKLMQQLSELEPDLLRAQKTLSEQPGNQGAQDRVDELTFRKERLQQLLDISRAETAAMEARVVAADQSLQTASEQKSAALELINATDELSGKQREFAEFTGTNIIPEMDALDQAIIDFDLGMRALTDESFRQQLMPAVEETGGQIEDLGEKAGAAGLTIAEAQAVIAGGTEMLKSALDAFEVPKLGWEDDPTTMSLDEVMDAWRNGGFSLGNRHIGGVVNESGLYELQRGEEVLSADQRRMEVNNYGPIYARDEEDAMRSVGDVAWGVRARAAGYGGW